MLSYIYRTLVQGPIGKPAVRPFRHTYGHLHGVILIGATRVSVTQDIAQYSRDVTIYWSDRRKSDKTP